MIKTLFKSAFAESRIVKSVQAAYSTFTESRFISDIDTFLSGHIGSKSKSGQLVTAEKALALSAYFACVRNISEDIAKVKIKIGIETEDEEGNEVFKADRNHPIARLMRQPNPLMSGMNFRILIEQWACSLGNGLANIERDEQGKPVALWPVHPTRVKWKVVEDELTYFVRCDDGNYVPVNYMDMFHRRGMGTDFWGYSITDKQSETIGIGLALMEYAASFLGGGGSVGGVLTHPETLSKPAYKRLRESWQKKYAGSQNAGKVAILEEGLKYEKIGMDNNAAQFIESKYENVEAVARAFRIPPHKIGHMLRSTFGNIEEQNIEYVIDCLDARYTSWNEEIDFKLLDGADGDLQARHDYSRLLMADMQKFGSLAQVMFYTSSWNPNEIRRRMGDNPRPGGNEYFVQGATIPVAMAGKVGNSQPEKNVPDKTGNK